MGERDHGEDKQSVREGDEMRGLGCALFVLIPLLGWGATTDKDLWWIAGLGVLVFVLAELPFGGGEKESTSRPTTALAKAEPAQEIEYIDDVINVRAGDTVVVANSHHQRQATAKEDTRIGVKRRWRGW